MSEKGPSLKDILKAGTPSPAARVGQQVAEQERIRARDFKVPEGAQIPSETLSPQTPEWTAKHAARVQQGREQAAAKRARQQGKDPHAPDPEFAHHFEDTDQS